jgi:hypothetical protein
LGLSKQYAPDDPVLPTLEDQGVWLKTRKEDEGLDAKLRHLNIGDVAKEVGLAELFYPLNRLLSKLVHPTAFSVLLEVGVPGGDQEKQMREWLATLGHGATEDALAYLIAYFESVGIDSTMLGNPAE